ncbi:DNA-(apurinic or apyrimidinic site) lyase [Savitreella phatthalungensis]
MVGRRKQAAENGDQPPQSQPTTPRRAASRNVKSYKEDEDDDEEEEQLVSSSKKATVTPSKKIKGAKAAKQEETSEDSGEPNQTPKKAATKRVSKKEDEAEDEKKFTTPRKRAKTSKDTEPEMPLASRSASRMFVGAHVSMAKSIANAVTNANHIGGNAFALFLKNQRKWVSPPMAEEDAAEFRKRMVEFKYDGKTQVLPHGSYLINLANDDGEKRQQAYDCFLDDLKRCERLGITRYNFHPGSTGSTSREKGIANVAACINRAVSETKDVTIVVENMAGHGNIIGGPIEELASIVEQVEDKSRVGVCLDTCHLFAAGHDIRTQDKYDTLISKFDKLVGLKYLCGWHLNDSKADLGANKDLHQNIGLGYLGLEPFRCIMNDARLEGMPLILETPCPNGPDGKEDKSVWAEEIKLLEWLIGKSADDPEVLKRASELAAKGAGDRGKALEAAERKSAKQVKDAQKAASKASKTKK